MIIGFVDFIKFIFLFFFKNIKYNMKKSLNNNNFNKLICVESDGEQTKKIVHIIENNDDFLNSKPNVFQIIE